MSAINEFLLSHDLRIASNPCVSPDFCLDWKLLASDLKTGNGITTYPKSRVATSDETWELVENADGDHAWIFGGTGEPLAGDNLDLGNGRMAYPATWKHLLLLNNLIQEYDPESTVFPTAIQRLGESTIGVGARFTTLHWQGVDWARAKLGIGVTANQNTIHVSWFTTWT